MLKTLHGGKIKLISVAKAGGALRIGALYIVEDL